MTKVTRHQADVAKALAKAELKYLGIEASVGLTGVKGQYAVRINLVDAPKKGVKMPRTINGVPVCVEITGVIKPR